MIVLSEYRTNEIIQQNQKFTIFRGTRRNDNALVRVKVLNNDEVNNQSDALLSYEFELLKTLEIPGISSPLDLVEYNDGTALVLEDDGSIPLSQLVMEGGVEIRQFLEIAIQITKTLSKVHQYPLVHLNIRPDNLLYHQAKNKITLTDFSTATALSTSSWTTSTSDFSFDSLAFMAPEQTGRMNRKIDIRTDIYSLGITFYLLLTGSLPFQADDPMEWVHTHIAKPPFPPHKFSPNIPEAVSDIVLMCLSKMAEDRYQSCVGLLADLEECLKRLKDTGKIEFFFPGNFDITDSFQIPQKIYGRDREINGLVENFERVAGTGSRELVLVCGYAGIGKSFLIYEMQKSIVEQRGYFIQGKFDQYQRHIPYDCLIQAFKELVRQLLTESDEQINVWKHSFQHALGGNGQVIIDVIPEVELILGKQPPLQKVPPDETQNRFNSVFQKFVQTIAKAEHPLVIYLDDLQWADTASLKLIELLITDPSVKYLLMIGAFRDNEIGESHVLPITLSNIKKAGIEIHEYKLDPLNIKEVTRFCADTLNCNKKEVEPLSELVYKKTHGNPFFMSQFLTALYEDQLISMDIDQKKWIWDIEKIQKKDISDNVVEFMSLKIQKLSKDAQNVLKLASCIGSQFNFNILSLVNENGAEESAKGLWELIEEGLIIADLKFQMSHIGRVGDKDLAESLEKAGASKFKFLHDRVQQAAYSLLNDQLRTDIHLKIGRLILEKTKEEELNENIFDIVNHLNFGADQVEGEDKLLELSKLNLTAGKKAKESTAYGSALEYMLIAASSIKKIGEGEGGDVAKDSLWQNKYELVSSIYREWAECEYLNGNFENAEQLFAILTDHVKTPLEKAGICSIKVVLNTNLGRNNQAVKLGLEGLATLGLRIPLNPSNFQIMTELSKVAWKLRKGEIEKLADLPPMVDEEKKMMMKIIFDLYPPVYFTNQTLLAYLILTVLKLTLKYGNAKDASPYAYCAFGFLLGSAFGRYELGYRFGKLGMDISEKYNNTKLIGFSNFTFGCFINNWNRSAKSSNEYLVKGYQFLVETGTFVYAGYSVAALIFNMSLNGDPLIRQHKSATKYHKFAIQIKDTNSENFFIIAQRHVLALQGKTNTPTSFSDNDYNEAVHAAGMKKTSEPVPLHWYYVKKMQLYYLFGRYEEVINISEKAFDLMETSRGQIFIVEHYFYDALAIAALYRKNNRKIKRELLQRLKKNQKIMDTWAKHCPENFFHKSLLIKAETARAKGKATIAFIQYDRSIESAKSNGFVQNAALASELKGEYLLEKGLDSLAKTFLSEAWSGYQAWGAISKLDDLIYRHSMLLEGVKKTSESPTSELATAHNGELDLTSIIKASQTLAGEILLKKLLKKLMQIVIENAGANKGFLILHKEGRWTIEAEGSIDKDSSITLQPFALELINVEKSPLPLSVFHYVERTRSNIVIEDATKEHAFKKDPYLTKHQPKSMLCTPILHQAKLIGMLYLENNLISGAFTPERLEILNLLSAQAAISIENACLYAEQSDVNEKLQKEINERKEIEKELLAINDELESSNVELKQTQSQLVQSAKLASIGELATGVAHELNQPLMYIRNSAQLAMMDDMEDFDRELIKETLEDIEKGTGHMMSIINHLREFARRTDLELVPLEVHEVLEESLILVNEQFRVRNILLEKKYSDSVPQISGNSQQLEQVFINILTNARDAIEDVDGAHIIIHTSSKKITEEDQEVIISFQDNGNGITEADMDKIFDPFFTTKEAGKGTGLGLSISYGIIRDHNGRIEVDTALGEGTKFNVILPASSGNENLF